MAHDVTTKAAAIALFAIGKRFTEVAKLINVPKSTVQEWEEEWQKASETSTLAIKQQRFADAVADFGVTTMTMLTAQAQMLSDPAYVKNLNTEEIIKHTGFIRDSLITINTAASFVETPALPERNEVIEGIPVDEETD